MKILGIDPGYDRVGIAVVEKNPQGKEVLLHSECLQTSVKDDFYTRLGHVGAKIGSVIASYSPDALAIETLFFTKNQKTAMRVAEARGVIIHEAIRKNISIFEYTPLQIKIAVTGHGGSDKSQMMKMIPLLVKIDSKKAAIARVDDEYDAIAVALTCCAREKSSFPQK
jgi:crossover junction endodeoxyribonuclease RuvC